MWSELCGQHGPCNKAKRQRWGLHSAQVRAAEAVGQEARQGAAKEAAQLAAERVEWQQQNWGRTMCCCSPAGSRGRAHGPK